MKPPLLVVAVLALALTACASPAETTAPDDDAPSVSETESEPRPEPEPDPATVPASVDEMGESELAGFAAEQAYAQLSVREREQVCDLYATDPDDVLDSSMDGLEAEADAAGVSFDRGVYREALAEYLSEVC